MIPRSHRLAALCFADIAGYTELSARNEGEAVAVVELLQDVARRATGGARWARGQVHRQLGRFDEAFEVLEQLVAAKDSTVPCIHNEALLEPLRSDPRYPDLIQRAGLA